MLKILIGLFVILISAFFLRPYLQNPAQRKVVIRLGLILLPLSILGYVLVMYVNHYSKPDSFEHGVALLRIDKGIQNKIGDFDSYTYFDKDLPNKKDNPAYFKVSLKGSIATIYLTCKMKKDTLGQWRIIEIKQDSLSKNSISE